MNVLDKCGGKKMEPVNIQRLLPITYHQINASMQMQIKANNGLYFF